MNIQILDLITRPTAVEAPRLRARRVPGGAALTAARKKKGKTCQKKERQRCTNDSAACRLTIAVNCGSPGTCGQVLACCESCTSGGFVECVLGLGAE